MRLLGLDIGSVRIGVAVSDPLGLFAQPLEVIDRRRVDPVARLVELVTSYEVSVIVVGKPVRLNGADGPAVVSVTAFADSLAEKVTAPITWWDERLTTAAAQRVMIDDGVRRDKRRQRIDKVAAALILQSYMDANVKHSG